ncbi:hypothetical protein M569_14476 [Genlisea aurea]|uniref:PB1 domain-containing protein n=1 Tax=Genlisea aurea TaxID=192259 RepID=S8DLH0_9LAMI|nr:hypothetical protein M569_14476 [Genlisea aurea]
MDSKVTSMKFLYSYGGRILPRSSDGKLRYVGGHTRVLSVDRSIAYSDLMAKFGELCGSPAILKCKLPEEDLDFLVTIRSEEELRSIIKEYEIATPQAKLIAVLVPVTSEKKGSPPPSPMSCFDFPSIPKPPQHMKLPAPIYPAASYRCSHPAARYPVAGSKGRRCDARNHPAPVPIHCSRNSHGIRFR